MSDPASTAPDPAPTPPVAPAPTASSSTVDDPPLSKNARKRLLKAEQFAASKAERRARDKEKRQEKKRARANDPDALEERRAKRRKVEAQVRGPKTPFRARIVVDLAFDELMSEKEVVSLCSQLAYTYSSNRKTRTPFEKLLCTSLNGKTRARLEALGGQYTRWHGVEFWEEGYEALWAESKPECAQESVVYLTGDAEEELEELREGETYIIGGICDRNRYKNLCLNKAKEQSIRSARLPIGKYLENLPTRKILTVNQVFDILLHWTEDRDWSKALYAVMPKRKFQQGSHSAGGSSANGDGDGAEDEAEAEAAVDVDAVNAEAGKDAVVEKTANP